MENSITCPNCKKMISNNPVIESAANGENIGSASITCDCGERITFWSITAQLRQQKTTGARFARWFRGLLKR